MDNRDKLLQLFCYGIGQGVKLADTDNPYKIGQHTEAMRITMLRIVRNLPADFQTDLIAALAAAGIDMELGPPTNEGTTKP